MKIKEEVNKKGGRKKGKREDSDRDRQRESSSPAESIQRGGAKYKSLGGGEIQRCKSNTLTRAHTHACTPT